MVAINKIILDHFSDPNNPKELKEILKSLLDIESSDSMKKTGVDKLYDIILKKYANNKTFVEWCKDYVE
jgi:hypothetical protein